MLFAGGTTLLVLLGMGDLVSATAEHGSPGELPHDASGASRGARSSVVTFLGNLLTVRSAAFFAFATGLVGVLCLLLKVLHGDPLLALAVATGIFSSFATALLTAFLRRVLLPNDALSSMEPLLGQVGSVLLAPSPTSQGKVRVFLAGERMDVTASSEEEGLQPGDAVLIVRVDGGLVHVCRADESLKLPS